MSRASGLPLCSSVPFLILITAAPALAVTLDPASTATIAPGSVTVFDPDPAYNADVPFGAGDMIPNRHTVNDQGQSVEIMYPVFETAAGVDPASGKVHLYYRLLDGTGCGGPGVNHILHGALSDFTLSVPGMPDAPLDISNVISSMIPAGHYFSQVSLSGGALVASRLADVTTSDASSGSFLQTQPLEITVDGIGVREVMATVTFTEDGVPQTYYLRSLAPVPVPEPVALAALGLVGGTAVLVRRRGTGAVGRVIGTPRRPGI